ncbi:MAG: DUF86 domain-containing protein [Firmicutes bacterium]|nr:DUF86 domain-containing protein [Bacillota bacterium]
MPRLEQVFRRHPQVIAAYLFGSQATGRATPVSDVDAGVLFHEGMDDMESFQVEMSLQDDLEKTFQTDNLDLIVLDKAPLPLQYNATSGKLLFSAGRFLQLAIETTFNTGNHILSTHNFEAPKDYSDIFLILGRHNVLPDGFAAGPANMARFRNRLVHLYRDIDTARVYTIIQTKLGDFEEFKRHVLEFLAKEED